MKSSQLPTQMSVFMYQKCIAHYQSFWVIIRLKCDLPKQLYKKVKEWIPQSEVTKQVNEKNLLKYGYCHSHITAPRIPILWAVWEPKD